MEGANHQRKRERKQTTSSVGSAGLSPQAGGSGGGIAAGREHQELPEHQEGWRQQPRPCSETKERHKTKNQSI